MRLTQQKPRPSNSANSKGVRRQSRALEGDRRHPRQTENATINVRVLIADCGPLGLSKSNGNKKPAEPMAMRVLGYCCRTLWNCLEAIRETEWWVLRGSNSRPTPCKGAALPTELSTRSRYGATSCQITLAGSDTVLQRMPVNEPASLAHLLALCQA